MPLSKIAPATGGLDVVSSPDYVDANKAPVVENVLVHLPGQTAMRGSLVQPSMPTTNTDWIGMASILAITGAWSIWRPSTESAYETIVSLRRNSYDATDTRRLEDNAQLGGNELYSFKPAADGTTAVVKLAASTGFVGKRFVQAGDYVYGYNSSLTTFTDSVVSTRLLAWNGTSTPFFHTNASPLLPPRGGLDVAEWQGRLFILGGYAPNGGTTRKDSTLWYSDPGGPLAGTLADWQDDVSGLVNQIKVGFGTEPSVGMARVGNSLLVLKAESIYQLTGTTQANWQVRPVTGEIGCTGVDSILEYDQGVFFMSRRGLMFYDGSNFDHVSADVDHLIDPAQVVQLTNMLDGYILVQARPRRGYGDTTIYPTTMLMYHTGSRAWVKITFDSTLGLVSRWVGTNAQGKPFFVATGGLYFIDKVTDPLQAAARDIIRTTSAPVYAHVRSRTQRLASPNKTALIHRFLVDTQGLTNQVGDPQDMGWYAKLVDIFGTTIKGPYLLERKANVEVQQRRRTQFDVGKEANDVALDIEWRAGTGTPGPTQYRYAAIYDAHIEYSTAQKRSNS